MALAGGSPRCGGSDTMNWVANNRRPMGRARLHRLFWVVLALALGLRLVRACIRYEENTFLYSAYAAPVVEAWLTHRPADALLAWTGLHPPLWANIHSIWEIWAPIPAVWIGASVLWSTWAVFRLGRSGTLAAGILSVAPLQLHYAAEVNDYPLLALGIAGLLTSRRPGLWGVMLSWTHAFGGLFACCWLLIHRRWWAVGGMVLGGLPLLLGLVGRLQEAGTFRQPPVKLGLILTDIGARFGWLWVLLLVLGLVGLWARARLAVGIGALSLGILVLLGVAAPHQYGPWSALGPPLALGVARAWPRAGWILLFGLGGIAIWGELGRALVLAQHVGSDAIPLAVGELSEPYHCEPSQPPDRECMGDAIVLLRPAGVNDDDKRRSSAELWAISPFTRLPRVQVASVRDDRSFELHSHGDHRQGQPRLIRPISLTGEVSGPFLVYWHDDLRPELSELPERHPRVRMVVYGHGGAPAYESGLARRLGATTERRGDSLILRIDRPSQGPDPG